MKIKRSARTCWLSVRYENIVIVFEIKKKTHFFFDLLRVESDDS